MNWKGRVAMWCATLIGMVLGCALVGIGIMFTFDNAQAREPAVVTVFGVPSAIRSPVFEYVKPRSVVLILDSENGQGSGVVIAKGRILTARHVIEKEAKLAIYLNQRLPTKVLKQDEGLDLALLEADVDCPCANIYYSTPVTDGQAVVIGYPIFTYIGLKMANPGSIQGINGNSLYVTASVIPGMSGGGVFVPNGDHWDLVGIVSGYPKSRAGSFPNVTVATSMWGLKEWIEQ